MFPIHGIRACFRCVGRFLQSLRIVTQSRHSKAPTSKAHDARSHPRHHPKACRLDADPLEAISNTPRIR